jgi:hypothetical protein
MARIRRMTGPKGIVVTVRAMAATERATGN